MFRRRRRRLRERSASQPLQRVAEHRFHRERYGHALQGGASSGEIDISTSNPACQTTGVVGYLSCAIDIAGIVPGTPYTFGFTTWDAAGGTGNQLSANNDVPFTATPGQTNVLQATLGGIASSLLISPMTPYRIAGSGTAFNVYGQHPVKFSVTPIDADDNFIIGPGAPQPVASLAPGANATLSALGSSSPNEWTLTSSYSATNPTVASATSIAVSATPVPGSGGATLTASVGISLYQPWIYVADGTANTILVFDEDGVPIAPAPAFNNVGPQGWTGGMSYGNRLLYTYSNYDGGSDAVLSAYSVLGGNAVYRIDGTANEHLGASIFAGGLGVNSRNGNVYIASTNSSNNRTIAFDRTLTTEVASIANTFGTGGGAQYIPQTGQVAYASSLGGVELCDAALSACSTVGSAFGNGGLRYDSNTQLIGYPASNGLQLMTLGGVNVAHFGQTMVGVAFDPYNGLWYTEVVISGSYYVYAYTESGTQVTNSFGSTYPSSHQFHSIAVVP